MLLGLALQLGVRYLNPGFPASAAGPLPREPSEPSPQVFRLPLKKGQPYLCLQCQVCIAEKETTAFDPEFSFLYIDQTLVRF